ncbi:hypothetical protein EV137_5348 [Kribbella pratensis]|uniref:Uncharacterized protein n=1 Tax=Kribbella pratensis TaxID=2512112 RepID=A0ABY2F9K9_9ACTN|nr:hypothetical protein [Kribbella pratensis]TDW87275.1 hypothetical protein EV137_5348 [Kribbella pratensis]
MAEIRDANEVYDEQVGGFATAVQAALDTVTAQQTQAAAFIGTHAEGDVHRPGPADAPSQ